MLAAIVSFRGRSGNYFIAPVDTEFTELLLEGKGEDGIDNTTK
jgi:hypothetical protein